MPRRPQPTPLQGWQDVLDLDGNADEGPLNSPSLDGLRTLSFERRVRCSRCHRKSTQGQSPLTRSNMISFGTNLYYCARCANMVGYPPR
ncbi:hypothetical protein BDY21DRAFT_333175 [Lineolata rhizophorae]|uniref:Uncharacterized protein n=1 Tax=Lineolata rhizophorae TaxID=578093 RepID=A0A6A6PD63_9PEZI|nr:hypothetical protein BDY21DRAFT_333175 [Lineolata rhizophorae]